jgi:hypothetical protein
LGKIGIRAFVIVVGMTLLIGFPALAQMGFDFKMTTSFYASSRGLLGLTIELALRMRSP